MGNRTVSRGMFIGGIIAGLIIGIICGLVAFGIYQYSFIHYDSNDVEVEITDYGDLDKAEVDKAIETLLKDNVCRDRYDYKLLKVSFDGRKDYYEASYDEESIPKSWPEEISIHGTVRTSIFHTERGPYKFRGVTSDNFLWCLQRDKSGNWTKVVYAGWGTYYN